MKMKKGLYVLIGFIAVVIFLLGVFSQRSCSSGIDYKVIEKSIKNEVAFIKKDLEASKTREEALLTQQENLEKALYDDEGLFEKLAKNTDIIEKLQGKLEKQPKPVKPDEFQTLNQCKKDYETLSLGYENCIKLTMSQRDQLNLFAGMEKNLMQQNDLLKSTVHEFKSQRIGWEKIESTVLKGMEEMDKKRQTKKFWRDVKNIGIGTAVGAAAAAILLNLLK